MRFVHSTPHRSLKQKRRKSNDPGSAPRYFHSPIRIAFTGHSSLRHDVLDPKRSNASRSKSAPRKIYDSRVIPSEVEGSRCIAVTSHYGVLRLRFAPHRMTRCSGVCDKRRDPSKGARRGERLYNESLVSREPRSIRPICFALRIDITRVAFFSETIATMPMPILNT